MKVIKQHVITDTVSIIDRDNGNLVVTAEVSNTIKGFFWRLVVGTESSPWCSHYEGVLTFKGYAYCTAYWEGVLPHEIPFKVVKFKPSMNARHYK